jgi:hypothetical protein
MTPKASRVAERLSLVLFMLTLGCSGVASALLIDRGPNMVYDNVLDITWVRDAHLCATLNNCVNRNDSIVTGGMTWADANTWAANLVYQGFSDWRLPYASVAAGAGGSAFAVYDCTGAGGADEVACRDNEMGYMFYYNLDGDFGDNKTGSQTAVGGEMLTDIQQAYWSGTQFNATSAWFFMFLNGGLQNINAKIAPLAAWAVRAGDVIVAPVPEPASGLLFGVGVLALASASRAWRRR